MGSCTAPSQLQKMTRWASARNLSNFTSLSTHPNKYVTSSFLVDSSSSFHVRRIGSSCFLVLLHDDLRSCHPGCSHQMRRNVVGQSLGNRCWVSLLERAVALRSGLTQMGCRAPRARRECLSRVIIRRPRDAGTLLQLTDDMEVMFYQNPWDRKVGVVAFT